MADFTAQKPFSLEAEQSVIGSILVNPECLNDVTAIVRGDDFYIPEHGEIYNSLCELFSKNREIDLVTLIDTLVSRGVYPEEECKSYVKVIAETVSSPANVKDYANIVREKSLLRALIDAADEISAAAYASRGETKYILDAAEQKIFNIARLSDVKNFVSIREALSEVFARMDELRKNPDAYSGVKTGYGELDRCLVGLGAGDFVLIGARPGVGKTTFAANIAINVAKSTKKTVCLFSLEMSAEQIASRMLASEALIDSYSIRTGVLKPGESDKIAAASAVLSDCDILIDDSTDITVTRMKGKLRRQKNLGLVVIDYLGLMQSDGKYDGNRVLEISEISRNLKLMAKDLKIPVLCCAQLSRAPDKQNDRRPELSDLRDSGAIEQDADIVMFLYHDRKSPENDNIVECIVRKNRHGMVKTINFNWIKESTRFAPLDEEHSSGDD